jgi:uncharacterized protein (TIGR03118 family)
MNQNTPSIAWLRPANGCLLFISCLALSFGCRKAAVNNNNNDLRDFQQVNLVSDNSIFSPELKDPTLQNAWGMAWVPSGIAWVNSMSDHVSELYTADGAIVRPPINIPSPTDTVGGLPTGIVFSGGAGFTLANKQAALFLFAGIDGVVSGWNGAQGNNAQLIGNNSSSSSYTGLALATKGGSHLLYAADFKTGKIDVWDTTFTPVKLPFRDPGSPRGFAPFNIQAIGSWLFVTYAKVGANGRDEAGQGLGFVDIFNTDGSFVKRFASGGALNAPWGVVETPANFLADKDVVNDDSGDSHSGNGSGNNGSSGGSNGSPGGPGGSNGSGNGSGSNGGSNGSGSTPGGPGDQNDSKQPVILVGNFGDGHISVFSLNGEFLGQLQSHNRTIVINGLWALTFPPSTATTIDPSRLYFTAGPDNETDGLFGYLIKE